MFRKKEHTKVRAFKKIILMFISVTFPKERRSLHLHCEIVAKTKNYNRKIITEPRLKTMVIFHK
jgi:hypothetical protein